MMRILRVILDDENRLQMGWRALAFFCVYRLTLILLQFPAGVLQLLLQPGAAGFDHRLAVLIATAGALLATWICTAAERVPLASVGLGFERSWFRELLWGSLGGIALMVFTALVILLAGGFRWTWNPQGSVVAILGGVPFYLLVALKEEVIFRGYPFQRLLTNLGPWPTQVLMALVFALFHWGNPGMSGATRVWALLNISLAGLLLGLCYLKTGRLALPIGVHLGWNWAQGHLLGFGVSGISNAQGLWKPVFTDKPLWLSGGSFGLEASLSCTVVCTAAILALLLWKPKRTPDFDGAVADEQAI